MAIEKTSKTKSKGAMSTVDATDIKQPKSTTTDLSDANAKQIESLKSHLADLESAMESMAKANASVVSHVATPTAAPAAPMNSLDDELRSVVRDMAKAMVTKSLSVRDFKNRWSGFLSS